MLKSMTGYSTLTNNMLDSDLEVEIKSVNSKSLNLRIEGLPDEFLDKESELRRAVSSKLKRGKIDIYINRKKRNDGKEGLELMRKNFLKLKKTIDFVDLSDEKLLELLLNKKTDFLLETADSKGEKNWEEINENIFLACEELEKSRLKEGTALEKQILESLEKILESSGKVSRLKEKRIPEIKEKYLTKIKDLVADELIDKDRLLQEILYYSEKLDITEELVRLQAHINYFKETVNSYEESGKKLSFITQEMGREINTIGSKANYFDIQKIVVEMKEELEKIKEQLLNIL